MLVEHSRIACAGDFLGVAIIQNDYINSFSHLTGFCSDERSAALLSQRMRWSHRTTPLLLRVRAISLLLFHTGRLSLCARPLELPASQASQSRHILLIPDFLCFFLKY